jgi:hypothetical protein
MDKWFTQDDINTKRESMASLILKMKEDFQVFREKEIKGDVVSISTRSSGELDPDDVIIVENNANTLS